MKKSFTLILSLTLILCIFAGCSGVIKGDPTEIAEKKANLPYISLKQAIYNALNVGDTIKNVKTAQTFSGDVYYFVEGTYIFLVGEDEIPSEERFQCVIHGGTGGIMNRIYGTPKGNLKEYRLEGLEGEIYITGGWMITGELGDFEHRDGKFYGKDGVAHYTDDDFDKLYRLTAKKSKVDNNYDENYLYAEYQIDPATIEDGLREVVGHTVTESDFWVSETAE